MPERLALFESDTIDPSAVPTGSATYSSPNTGVNTGADTVRAGKVPCE